MAKDINKNVFDEATILKLDIFGQCFEEWFPVFLHSPWYERLYIFDFFAGSGKDKNNISGSPLVLLEKAKGKNNEFCQKAKKEVKFLFNDDKADKSKELKENVSLHIENCKQVNNCDDCIFTIRIESFNFQDIFSDPGIRNIFKNNNFGKFVLLDQYGFSQIDEDVFKQLISFPKTDFIFFIASSFIKRFREHPNTTKYINTSKIKFENLKPNEVHRGVAEYFRDLIPAGKEYYLHHFSIRKDAKKGNYYGLIFGSNHTLGMEKFLKVCWSIDMYSGEANYNIDNNYGQGSLFENENVKKDSLSNEIKQLILSGEISDNITGLKYAMKNGCEPSLFTEVVKKMEKEKLIERSGTKKYTSTNIHKADFYQIIRIQNGT